MQEDLHMIKQQPQPNKPAQKDSVGVIRAPLRTFPRPLFQVK